MDTLATASASLGGLGWPPDGPDAAYRPGACNIGAFEIARRRRAGLMGVAGAGVLAIGLLAVDAPQLARLLVLFPLWGGFVSLLQVRRRFCVGFAFAGLENFGDEEAARRHVVDEDARAADRRAGMRNDPGCVPAGGAADGAVRPPPDLGDDRRLQVGRGGLGDVGQGRPDRRRTAGKENDGSWSPTRMAVRRPGRDPGRGAHRRCARGGRVRHRRQGCRRR